jgi:hypothetical protein
MRRKVIKEKVSKITLILYCNRLANPSSTFQVPARLTYAWSCNATAACNVSVFFSKNTCILIYLQMAANLFSESDSSRHRVPIALVYETVFDAQVLDDVGQVFSPRLWNPRKIEEVVHHRRFEQRRRCVGERNVEFQIFRIGRSEITNQVESSSVTCV